MKKPKKESVPTAIRLPRDDYERLKKLPGGVPVAIKRGLDWLALEETADEPTRDFALMIFELAREVELETGAKWHTDAGAYRALRRAIITALARWRPEGVPDSMLEDVLLKPFEERPSASNYTRNADEAGVYVAQIVLEMPGREQRDRFRAVHRQSTQEILQLHKNRGEEGND